MNDDQEIQAAIATARLPRSSHVDRDALARGIQHAIEVYWQTDAPDHVVAKAIRDLHKLARKVAAGDPRYAPQLAEMFERLPAAARCLLSERDSRLASRRGGRVRLPSVAQLANPANACAAAADLRDLIQSGATLKEGRQRPGGKRSRPTVRPILRAPKVKRGHPTHWRERALLMWLAIAWLEATGREPPCSAHHDKRGPFVRLVAAVLESVGARYIDAVELVNWYGRERGKRTMSPGQEPAHKSGHKN